MYISNISKFISNLSSVDFLHEAWFQSFRFLLYGWRTKYLSQDWALYVLLSSILQILPSSMSYWFSRFKLSNFFLLCPSPNSHLRCLTWKPASCQIFLRHAYLFFNTSDHRAEYDAFFRRHALRHWILWTYKKSKHIDLRGRPCSAFESCCWFSQANSSALGSPANCRLRNAIKSTGRESHRFWKHQWLQRTTLKSPKPNSCHRVWKYLAFQWTAVTKSLMVNSCHRVGNFDVLQATASGKSTPRNSCHRVGNGDVLQGTTTRKGRALNFRQKSLESSSSSMDCIRKKR